MSLKLALFLFTKKLWCLLDIQASPKLVSNGTDSLISSQTFLLVCSMGFLKVLPLVLILVGCVLSFLFFNSIVSFLMSF